MLESLKKLNENGLVVLHSIYRSPTAVSSLTLEKSLEQSPLCDKLADVAQRYSDSVFLLPSMLLPSTDHWIETGNIPPVYKRAYKRLLKELKVLHDQLENLLAEDASDTSSISVGLE
ncbi:hypothetical protein BGZ58_004236, partial [Dissophora ornata]